MKKPHLMRPEPFGIRLRTRCERRNRVQWRAAALPPRQVDWPCRSGSGRVGAQIRELFLPTATPPASELFLILNSVSCFHTPTNCTRVLQEHTSSCPVRRCTPPRSVGNAFLDPRTAFPSHCSNRGVPQADRDSAHCFPSARHRGCEKSSPTLPTIRCGA